MTIFDLLFILLFLASVVTLLTALVVAMRGRFAKALHIVLTYAACFAIYMAIVFAMALAVPQRIVPLGEPRCFDDWCIAIDHAEHSATPEGVSYAVAMRVLSRAKRVDQRERGVQVYLIDAQGRRFAPRPDPSAIPLDVLVHPGDVVEIKRSYLVPNDARGVGAVAVHEGSFCFPGCFIIGDDGNPVRKPTVTPLP